MVGAGVPDSIAGIWLTSDIAMHSGDLAERILPDCAPPFVAQPALVARHWGAKASLGRLTMVGDLRLEHSGELAAAMGRPDLAAAAPELLFLHCWESWGARCLPRLEGEFAVAIWDSRARVLTLARDALGQRPLHFKRLERGIAFASRGATLASATGQAAPDLNRMAAMLAMVPEPGTRSFLEGVERVVPGHYLSIDGRGRIRHRRWWRPRLDPIAISPAEAEARMRLEIDRAVGAALATDSRIVAAHLSGGHDSTLVVEAASRLTPPGVRLLAVTGESAGEKAPLPPDAFDDVEVARETAAMLPGVEHVIASAPPQSPLAAVDRWSDSDQPILNPYNLGWLDRSYAAAREAGATVLLSAVNGNVTVSPYGIDRLALLARCFRLPTLRRELLARRRLGAGWMGLLSTAFGRWIPERLWLRLTSWRGRPAEYYDQRAFLNRASPVARSVRKRARASGFATSAAPTRLIGSRARFAALQWDDPGPGNHFVRARYGLEVREPLGSRRLVELSLRLRAEHFFREGRGRRLSRALLEGRVPERVTSEDRTGFQGLNWLASAALAGAEIRREIELIRQDPELSQLFDGERLRRCFDAWPSSGWSDAEQNYLYQGSLTTAVVAAHWARRVRERSADR